MAVTVILVLTSCGASVFVIDNSQYNTVWQRDWNAAIKDSLAWKPASGSPGVCDNGGSLQGCYNSDEAVIPDLQQLLKDLTGSVVPAAYQTANATIRTGLQDDVTALEQRNDAIRTNSDTECTDARTKALTAAHEIATGYAQFPVGTAPVPTPFGGGPSW